MVGNRKFCLVKFEIKSQDIERSILVITWKELNEAVERIRKEVKSENSKLGLLFLDGIEQFRTFQNRHIYNIYRNDMDGLATLCRQGLE